MAGTFVDRSKPTDTTGTAGATTKERWSWLAEVIRATGEAFPDIYRAITGEELPPKKETPTETQQVGFWQTWGPPLAIGGAVVATILLMRKRE